MRRKRSRARPLVQQEQAVVALCKNQSGNAQQAKACWHRSCTQQAIAMLFSYQTRSCTNATFCILSCSRSPSLLVLFTTTAATTNATSTALDSMMTPRRHWQTGPSLLVDTSENINRKEILASIIQEVLDLVDDDSDNTILLWGGIPRDESHPFAPKDNSPRPRNEQEQ
jgi:hypothetical protein